MADRRLCRPRVPIRLPPLRRGAGPRYPWIREYTLFNEPFSTLFLSGHEAIWPPYHRGLRALVESCTADGLNRAWLEVPDPGRHVGFFDHVVPRHTEQLPGLIGPTAGERVVWLYTPLALEIALALQPTTLVYDVMDDLAAFKDAAPELVVRQRQALRLADVVYAGGRSIHNSIVPAGPL